MVMIQAFQHRGLHVCRGEVQSIRKRGDETPAFVFIDSLPLVTVCLFALGAVLILSASAVKPEANERGKVQLAMMPVEVKMKSQNKTNTKRNTSILYGYCCIHHGTC